MKMAIWITAKVDMGPGRRLVGLKKRAYFDDLNKQKKRAIGRERIRYLSKIDPLRLIRRQNPS